MKSKSVLENECIIAVDFDGTITTESDLSNHELQLKEGAYEALHRLHEDGFKLVLWTCRGGHNLEEALVFLDDEGLLEVFDTINQQLPEVKEAYADIIGKKVGADIYIDDKNIFTKEVNWKEIEKYIYGE